MSKTITIRLDEDTYHLLKLAANGEKRTLSNYFEYAALSYTSQENHVSDQEMNEILKDKELINNFLQSKEEIAKGKYKIVQ
ncbi:CopG family transcriptional regulator [Candidatus Margulisiibacteriota bacterium]